MKTSTALLLSVVILWCIEVDAGSFNLSGSFDPGISFGRLYSIHQRYQARNVEDDDESDWPQPNHDDINHVEWPESFNDPIPDDFGPNDNERP